jgi:Leucine-rich repeat (LRR) protein
MGLLHTGLVAGLLFIVMIQTGCTALEQYDITINNVTVYEPVASPAVQGVEDPALEDCLQQTLEDTQASEPNTLERLNCSNAGISTLAGLEQFQNIRSLKLSGNRIRNLLVLERLTKLQQLWLDGNDIVDPIPVLRLSSLRQLDLADNPRLQCPAHPAIPASMELTLPGHCKPT